MNWCVCHSQNSAFAYHQLNEFNSVELNIQSLRMLIVNIVYKGRIIRTGIKILGNVCLDLNMKSSEKLHLKKFNSDLFLLSVFQLLGRIHSSHCQHFFCWNLFFYWQVISVKTPQCVLNILHKCQTLHKCMLENVKRNR